MIAFRDFLEDVKYSIPEKVTSLIAAAYNKLDPKGTNNVSLQTIINTYNAEQHPHVLSRRKLVDQARAEFANGITRKAVDNNVSRQEFVDYYA